MNEDVWCLVELNAAKTHDKIMTKSGKITTQTQHDQSLKATIQTGETSSGVGWKCG
jgi:hypothetical protein